MGKAQLQTEFDDGTPASSDAVYSWAGRRKMPDAMNQPLGCPFYGRCTERMDICHNADPRLVEVSNEHLVACYARESTPASA